MYFDEIYNFRFKYFSKFRMIFKINVRNHDFYELLMVLTIKITFAGIFTIIFVISASKYMSMQSFQKIRGKRFSEMKTRHTQILNQKFWNNGLLHLVYQKQNIRSTNEVLEFLPDRILWYFRRFVNIGVDTAFIRKVFDQLFIRYADII